MIDENSQNYQLKIIKSINKSNMNFPKIMVALDRSGLDKTLIEYSQFITTYFKATTAHFFHVVPHYMPSNILDSRLENLLRKKATLAGQQSKDLENKIYAVFEKEGNIDLNLSVIEGKPQDQLLSIIRERKPSLLVLGKKQISEGSGITARRIARKADCPIWFVTENANTDLKKILVPIESTIDKSHLS